MQMMRNCPMHLPGAKVEVLDTADGVALTLTADAGSVDELRRRVQFLVSRHNERFDKLRVMPHARILAGKATYEEVPNGAKLMLVPRDPAQLEAFRTQVHERVERLQGGDCLMMEEMMGEPDEDVPAEDDR
jgi:hypothetical protein